MFRVCASPDFHGVISVSVDKPHLIAAMQTCGNYVWYCFHEVYNSSRLLLWQFDYSM